MKYIVLGLGLTFAASSAFAMGHASGDAAAGEKVFGKCASCHTIANDAGEVLAGSGRRTGPNLYGVVGRQAGSADGFRGYSSDLIAAGEAGLVWDEETFVANVQNPSGFLREVTGNNRARSKMAFQLRGSSAAEDATNVWAFIASLSPEPSE